jgi:hypothetical protein
MESLDLLPGGICPGEHLLRIELEQLLQRLGLVGGASNRIEHEAAVVQVDGAGRIAAAPRLRSVRKAGSAITMGRPRAGADVARLNKSRPLVR